jgi:hypothetical protein
MNLKVKASSRKVDVRDSVGHLTMEAKSPHDVRLLTRLYQTMVFRKEDPEVIALLESCEREASEGVHG